MGSAISNIEIIKEPIFPEERKGKDCIDILKYHQLDSIELDHHLQVGNIPSINGWIVHISVIRLHFTPLLEKILPQIIETDLPFRIPKDKESVRMLLNGNLGLHNIGKILSIYSPHIEPLVRLAKVLVTTTGDFRGPAIPGCYCLGGCAYTQYDSYTFPVLTDHLTSHPKNWPFSDILPLPKPLRKPLWNNRYRPLSVIKPDPKGRVIQANYFKNLFNIKMCIIKEGIKNMWADEFGRDIVDRIKWQYDLYKQLEGHVPTPQIFDFFEDGGNVYLTMDFIKGKSFTDKVLDIYAKHSWFQLSNATKVHLVSLFLKILDIIKKLHALGFVHRDITPANFIIDEKENFHLIDMELTYSMTDQNPNPPFKLGTPGYISPEQRKRQTPTVKEDIYAIGAAMVFTFCGLSITRIDNSGEQSFFRHLIAFNDNYDLVSLIVKCFSANPEARPTLEEIINLLEKYKTHLQNIRRLTNYVYQINQSHEEVSSIVFAGLRATLSNNTLTKEGIWSSPQNADTGTASMERTVETGFDKGIAGILFILGKAAHLGYGINEFENIYNTNYQYLHNALTRSDQQQDTSLFNGSAGIALAINEGLEGKYITNSAEIFLKACFANSVSTRTDLAYGGAGQGISLLRCRRRLPSFLFENKIEELTQEILYRQEKNGSWLTLHRTGKKVVYLGLSTGVSGILCFLIAYCQTFKNEQALTALRKGLQWLALQSKDREGFHRWSVRTKSNYFDPINPGIGMPGIALTFIRAYHLLKDPQYKVAAENALRCIPRQLMFDDLTQISGVAGVGEIYLDAYALFKSEEWSERLNWITHLLINTFIREKEIGYWHFPGSTELSSDLMTGNCGIIHFLMRTQQQNNDPGHILLGKINQ